MEFTEQFQHDLIRQMAAPADVLKRCGHLLKSEMFDAGLQGLVEQVLTLWRKGRTLSKGQLQQLCYKEKVKLSPSSGAGDWDFTEKEIMRFGRYMLMRDALTDAKANLEAGKEDNVVPLVTTAWKKLPKKQTDEQTNILTAKRQIPKRINTVSTGLRELDEHFDGGVAGGELAVIVGCTSGGKSSFLVHLAAAALEKGQSVCYCTLEDPAVGIEGKLRCRLTTQRQPTGPAWERARERLTKKKVQMYVREYSSQSASVSDIDADVPAGVGLIIVDYADYLRPSGGGGIEYQDLGHIFNQLKDVAKERKIPLWTASQVNREGYAGDDQINVQYMAASMRKAHIADKIVTINQSVAESKPDDAGKCTATLFIAKNRQGMRYQEVPVTVDFAMSLFTEGKWAS